MYTIPKHTLLHILGRSEPWLQGVWNDRYPAWPLPTGFSLHEALVILSRCPKRMRVWECSLDLKLPIPTWRIIRTRCEKAGIGPDLFCKLLTCKSIDDIRKEKIDVMKTQPKALGTHGGKIRFRKFCVYALCGLKLMAIAFRVSVSAIMDWLVWQWIESRV